MINEHHISQRQACQAVSLPRSSFAYQAKPKHDEEVIEQLSILTEKYPSIGFWKCFHRLRKQWPAPGRFPGIIKKYTESISK